jgi:hypothetical protein
MFCCHLILYEVVDPVGVEPTASALQVRRSPAELRAHMEQNERTLPLHLKWWARLD